MELLVLAAKANASPLVPFLEERGVRVRVIDDDPPTASPRRPDAILVMSADGREEAVERLRRRWPGVPVLTCAPGGVGDAVRRRRAARRRAHDESGDHHPGEIAFRLAQLVHGARAAEQGADSRKGAA